MCNIECDGIALPKYRVICNRIPRNEVINAECLNLTGGWPDSDGVAECRGIDRVGRSAFLTTGIRCLAEGNTLEALVAQIANLQYVADRFRIEVLRLSEAMPLDHWTAVISLSNAILGLPDLNHPQNRFLLVVQSDRLWFGEIMVENEHSYRRHDAKPHRTSSSLPSRLARALVNLVTPPASTILDPFCGTGSILLEAQALGLQAYGMDINAKMTGMTKRNLAYFGYQAAVVTGDARDCQQRAEAIVTDLPYGRVLTKDNKVLKSILIQLKHLAPRIVCLSDGDISEWLDLAGYAPVEALRVQKGNGIIRFVHCGGWPVNFHPVAEERR